MNADETATKSDEDGVFQVVMLDVMKEPFERWLAKKGLRMGRIPVDSDDLPTYVITFGEGFRG